MKYKIAIVEDDKEAAERLRQLVEAHPVKEGISFTVSEYRDAFDFLENFHQRFDVIFLDIQMPGMSGMEAAKRVRKEDKDVLIIFVTNLAQYAVDGYEVNAYDFILKPVGHGNFTMKFNRILNKLEQCHEESVYVCGGKNVTKKFRVADIYYVEVDNHDLIYHTSGGDFKIRGTISQAEQQLLQYHFSRCNSCYLINLKHISDFSGDTVVVHGDNLKIAQKRKQSFMKEFAKYINGGV